MYASGMLPVRILGAILNHIDAGAGAYKYYSYSYGYSPEEELEEANGKKALAGGIVGTHGS